MAALEAKLRQTASKFRCQFQLAPYTSAGVPTVFVTRPSHNVICRVCKDVFQAVAYTRPLLSST